MNGPIKMYAMSQIVRHDLPVELPKCMYRLNNIHVDGDSKSKNGTVDVCYPNSHQATNVEIISEKMKGNTTPLIALQQKQEVILQQLEDLKKQMSSIRHVLMQSGASNTDKTTSSTTHSTTGPITMKSLPHEITINASPNNIPYSLLFLRSAWKHVLNIKFMVYTHSTISALSEAAQQFNKALETTDASNNKQSLIVRLIWKDIGSNQLELCGSRPIEGEVNFLRYMARLTNGLNYNEKVDEVDSLLDMCHAICRSKTKVERASFLSRLSKKLGKSEYIFNEYSIVDIASYSAVKQSCSSNEINVGLTRWMKNCEAVAALQ